MVGKRPERYVLDTERRVLRLRPHWVMMVRPLVETIGIIAVLWLLSIAFRRIGPSAWLLSSVVYYAELAMIGRLAWKLLYWWDDRIIVTNKRLMRVTGVLNDHMVFMPISKVTDMEYDHTFLGKLLGYGYIRLETAGQKQGLEHLRYLPHPEVVYEVIAKSVFGEDGLPAPKRGRKLFGKDHSDLPDIDDLSREFPTDSGDGT